MCVCAHASVCVCVCGGGGGLCACECGVSMRCEIWAQPRKTLFTAVVAHSSSRSFMPSEHVRAYAAWAIITHQCTLIVLYMVVYLVLCVCEARYGGF